MKIYKINLTSIIFYTFLFFISVNGNAKVENCFAVDQKGKSQKYENGNYFGSIKNVEIPVESS